jgi:hypothetical protein
MEDIEMIVIVRKEAKAKGLKRYFTGKACVHGHIVERFTCNKECVECDRIRRINRRAKAEVKTHIHVVSVPQRKVRIVRFKVVGNPRAFMKHHEIISDRVVNI